MMIFVHGFPECWYSWRHQMRYFCKDYRVVALDQRGYGLSSKAPYVSDYQVEVLAGDVADLIEQLGYESCILVGHDWGGVVAWTTAMLYDEFFFPLHFFHFSSSSSLVIHISSRN